MSAKSPIVWTKNPESILSETKLDPVRMPQSSRQDPNSWGKKKTLVQIQCAMLRVNLCSRSADGQAKLSSAHGSLTAHPAFAADCTGLWLLKPSHDAWSQFRGSALRCTVGRPPTGPVLAWLHGRATVHTGSGAGAVQGGFGDRGPIPE